MMGSETKLPAIVRIVSSASNAGKTTLIERLIPRLRKRGLRIGTVKHAHHGFDLDHQGKDSWRHTQAGAEAVALVSPSRSAWFIQTQEEPSCSAIIDKMGGCINLVLVEGFKRDNGPQIILEPESSTRFAVTDLKCMVGVRPDELTSDEMDILVRFCTDVAAERIQCRQAPSQT